MHAPPTPALTHPAERTATVHAAAALGSADEPRRVLPTAQDAAVAAPLRVHWARHQDEVRAAQRLRYQVFAEEMGAQLLCPPGTPAGLDADRFDDVCEHLTVWAEATDEQAAQVVGTYRVLTPAGAALAGGLYTETEFDLQRLDDLRPHLAELGRSCTAPAWRQGGVVMMLWAALAEFLHRNGLHSVVGCASVSMHDGGHSAASLWRQLSQQHMAPAERQVSPRLPLPLDHLRQDLPAEPPPLVKGYLKCGAQLLGAPAWDPAFGVADLPLLMQLDRLPPAYRRRFLPG